MKLKRLKLKNIRSYEEQEIIFPEGSLLLSGDVGSGKTSILLAIEYAIFGMQPGQKGTALLRNNAISGEVLLDFEISGKQVTIERGLKRTGSSVTGEFSSITIDGEKFELSATEVKTKVLTLLGYPQEFVKRMNLLYRYTVYTPQEQMKQIILEDSEVRLNIIRHIFGMDKYKRVKENLVVALNRLKEESKELQGEIKSLEDDKNNLSSIVKKSKSLDNQINTQERLCKSLIESRKSIEKEFQDIESKLKEKQNLEKEVEKTNILIVVKNESLVSLKAEILSLEKQISDFNQRFDESQYEKTKLKIKELSDKYENLNTKRLDLISLEKSLESKRKDYLERKERFFDIVFCPTCLQDVPSAHKHNVLNESESKLSEIRNQLLNLGKEISEHNKLIDETKLEMANVEKQKTALEILNSKKEYHEQLKKKLIEYQKNKASLEEDTSLLTKHLDGLKKDISDYLKFAHLLTSKQEELKNAFRNEKNSEIALAEFKKERQLISKEIETLELAISKKELSKKKLSNLLELMDWLSTNFVSFVDYVERSVLLKLRVEFSKLFNKWFHMLAGTAFEVQLDENFTPLIMQSETEMEYQFLSGGERTAVALAYRLALNQTINSIMSQINTKDLVILDEPTDGFSEAQIDKIRDILDELKVAQLIIVSHEQKIESFVENLIKFKKESMKSEIISE